MRLVRDGLLAFVVALVAAGIAASVGPHHLARTLWIGAGVAAVALVLIVWADAKRPWRGMRSPVVWRGWRSSSDEHSRRQEDPQRGGQGERPTLTCEFLSEGDHFWIEISNNGPTPVPDPPLLLNLLVPRSWNVHSGDGNFAATRETLTDLKGMAVPAWVWSFKDDDPPAPYVRQTYEFKFNEAPASGIYPVATLIHGYARFDGVLAIGVSAEEAEEAVQKARGARSQEPGERLVGGGVLLEQATASIVERVAGEKTWRVARAVKVPVLDADDNRYRVFDFTLQTRKGLIFVESVSARRPESLVETANSVAAAVRERDARAAFVVVPDATVYRGKPIADVEIVRVGLLEKRLGEFL